MNRYDPRQMAQPHGPAISLPVPHGGLMAPGSGGGGLVRIIPKIEYALYPADNETETIILAKYVDTTLWVSGLVLVRVHEVTLSGSQSFAVTVQNTSFAEEEPSSDFVHTSAVATAAMDSATAPPTLLRAALSAPIGPQVRVILTAAQKESSGTAMSCTIGVDLVGRQA